MAEEKCFCHLNGYKVKDADARKEIETLKEQVNNVRHVDTEARAAAAAAQAALDEHKAAEVIDSTARSAILGLEEDLDQLAGQACEDTVARTAASEAKNLAASAGMTAGEAKTAAATNANSITGHETRIGAIETAFSEAEPILESHENRIQTLESNSGGSSGGSGVVDKEITISFTNESNSSAYATIYNGLGEYAIKSGTSQTIRVIGILGIEVDWAAHTSMQSNDGAISNNYLYEGIRYFAIKDTTTSITIHTTNSTGGGND